ncbi:MAG: PAS domain S-box protein [Candidatus Krumholzibacteria bacterium]|nr:PAS domain S-box protein [Candidatus Krumholzibacteria bacterium]
MGIGRPEEYLESIFESSPVLLISLDMRFRIIMFNKAACMLTGYASECMTGKRITKIIRLRDLKKITKPLRNGRISTDDGFMIKMAGSGGIQIPVMLKISPLFDSENTLIGALLVASDLREIREVQAKMFEAERLAAITETAISVNHEINNPLCSILGNTQLMLMEKDHLDSRMIKKLESIEKQIARIQDIAERLGKITKPVLKEYVGGKKMLDVEHSEVKNPG